MAAMALGALVVGVPHFEGSTTSSLAPKTGEAPAQQLQPPQPPQQQADEGHHPLKKMQKRVLAHAHKGKLERAHEKMRQVERARESAGRRGEEKQKREKKVRAVEKMRRVRARKDEAARAPSAQEAQVRAYRHALTLSLSLSLSLALTRYASTSTDWRRARHTRTTTGRPPTARAPPVRACTRVPG